MTLKSFFLSTISAVALAGGAAQSETVNLRAVDGSFDLEGRFVDYTDGRYVVETQLGRLRIKAARVDCVGAMCPNFDVESADIRVMVSDQAEMDLTLRLFEAFAASKGASVRVFEMPGRDAVFADLLDDQGDLIHLAAVSENDSRSLMALRSGAADIAYSTRPAASRLLVDELIGLEGLVAITHPRNPFSELGIDQVRAILAGTVTNWSELGGEDRPIRLARSVRGQALLPVGGVAEQTAARVLADEGALGFVPLAEVGNARRVGLLDSCGKTAVPDLFAMKTGQYPFAAQLYMHHRIEPATESARDFAAFALSDEAGEMLRAANLLDPKIEAVAMEADGPRARMLAEVDSPRRKADAAREMLSMMVDYQRLSATFRFLTGSSDIAHLDDEDFARLAEYLGDAPDGTHVVFVGFSDEVGTFRKNSLLSLTRARQIADAVQRVGGETLADLEFEVAGFGELAPVACNSDETGRSLNRRVEVWIDTSRKEEMQTALNRE